MTQEQIERCAFSDEEVQRDIDETAREIKDFSDEKEVLMRNPQANKLRIYMLEANISKRQTFIENIQQILDYRKSKKAVQ